MITSSIKEKRVLIEYIGGETKEVIISIPSDNTRTVVVQLLTTGRPFPVKLVKDEKIAIVNPCNVCDIELLE
jgi:hypothetical protein